jgi:hypothetical protein
MVSEQHTLKTSDSTLSSGGGRIEDNEVAYTRGGMIMMNCEVKDLTSRFLETLRHCVDVSLNCEVKDLTSRFLETLRHCVDVSSIHHTKHVSIHSSK